MALPLRKCGEMVEIRGETMRGEVSTLVVSSNQGRYASP